MQLKDTVEMMLSDDYKERLKAEYHQTVNRFIALKRIIRLYKAGKFEFSLTCSIELLEDQVNHMEDYLFCLEERAKAEGIDL